MKKIFCLIVILLTGYSFSFSQGIVRGKITDENGEAVIGVTVVLKSNASIGSVADLDGNYSIKMTDSTTQTLVISYLGYQTVEEPVKVSDNKVVIKNFTLKPATKDIGQVEIVGKSVKSRDYYVEKMKRNSAVTIDYISSETMKKTGDPTVAAAIARVSGVSSNGGYITVRGIGDRYVKTAVNGLMIPTLDPFTNNIKLDIFPANLVDNIIITKTASPDLPGDWAGAYISVETKDYPDQLAINYEINFGYNSPTTFNNYISSQHSSTDWLGYDNGLREQNHDEVVEANIDPTQYQELVALGLGPYFTSIGVNADNWGEGTSTGDLYFKLGLVQLGLLPPALINDPTAVATAKNLYQYGSYSSDAFKVINAKVPESGKSFANNWSPEYRKAPLNFNQTFSIGNQTKIFGMPVGFLAGFRYARSVMYDESATEKRAGVSGDGQGNTVPTVTSAIEEAISKEFNGWSALLNLAFKINPNNSLSFLFMPNLLGTNQVRSAADTRDSNEVILTKGQIYEERRQLIYQLKFENYIPVFKLKTELSASYTNGKSSVPDFKNLTYLYYPKTETYQIGSTTAEGIHRYYRYLTDKLFDSRLSFEFPLGDKKGLARKFKFGGAYMSNDKNSDQYDYSLNLGPRVDPLVNDDLEDLFSHDNFEISTYTDNDGITHSTINEYYTMRSASAANFTFGTSSVVAGYLMLDYSISPSIRIAGGIRVEHAKILTDVVQFHALGLAPDDPRRTYNSGLPGARPGELDETSYLPGVNLIYKIRKDEDRPINLRLNYSQTVARPSIRELSDVAVYDYEFRSPVFGNSDLKMVRINNYDMRLESYFRSGDNISSSVFYKQFKNHIELVRSNGYTWQNVDNSYVVGIELEGKKKLTKHFDILANLTLAKSQTEFVRSRLEVADGVKHYIAEDTVKRSMFGQAPYVFNAIVAYKADSIRLLVTLSYNVQGPRLVVASDNKAVSDVYEQPRHLLDLKISKKFGKHFSVAFTIKDILGTPIVRSYKGRALDYDNYNYGTNYQVGLTYNL